MFGSNWPSHWFLSFLFLHKSLVFLANCIETNARLFDLQHKSCPQFFAVVASLWTYAASFDRTKHLELHWTGVHTESRGRRGFDRDAVVSRITDLAVGDFELSGGDRDPALVLRDRYYDRAPVRPHGQRSRCAIGPSDEGHIRHRLYCEDGIFPWRHQHRCFLELNWNGIQTHNDQR